MKSAAVWRKNGPIPGVSLEARTRIPMDGVISDRGDRHNKFPIDPRSLFLPSHEGLAFHPISHVTTSLSAATMSFRIIRIHCRAIAVGRDAAGGG